MQLSKKDCSFYRCSYKDISKIFKEYHYKTETIGGGISQCFAMFINGKLVGGSVLGLPRHSGKYPGAIDIRRMALIDEAPKNSESCFLGAIIRWIAANTEFDKVLSYSDKSVGHTGTIYKASNFTEIGETSPTKWVEWNGKKYHPRSITIERSYSHRMRAALDNGEAELITGLPKKIWIYSISKKLKRKKCFFPELETFGMLSLF